MSAIYANLYRRSRSPLLPQGFAANGPSPSALTASGLGLAQIHAFGIEAGRRIVIQTHQQRLESCRARCGDYQLDSAGGSAGSSPSFRDRLMSTMGGGTSPGSWKGFARVDWGRLRRARRCALASMYLMIKRTPSRSGAPSASFARGHLRWGPTRIIVRTPTPQIRRVLIRPFSRLLPCH
jgi:hypothetical protein